MNEHNNPTPESIIKKLSIELLRCDSIVIVSDTFASMADNINYNNHNTPLSEHHTKCIKVLGIDSVIPSNVELKKKCILNNKILASWLLKAETLGLASVRMETTGLIKPSKDNTDGRVTTRSYSITSKGLEVALKLQEHEDNERRFEQQNDISKVLQDNSSKSVTTARWALALSVLLVSFGGYRVYQLEQKILSHSNMEQRINSAEEESSRLNGEVVRLKDELNRLISVDNDKGKPVAVIVDSNTPTTEP